MSSETTHKSLFSPQKWHKCLRMITGALAIVQCHRIKEKHANLHRNKDLFCDKSVKGCMDSRESIEELKKIDFLYGELSPQSLWPRCEAHRLKTENSIETSIPSRVIQIASLAWTHETSAGWCTGKTQRDRVEREIGGRIGMGNTCKSMADSCQCTAKTTTIL